MLLSLLYLLSCSVGLVLLSSSSTDTFMFPFCPETLGAKNNGRVTFNAPGGISKEQKVVYVPITIDYCMILTEVRVDVDNPVGPPIVRLDRDMHVVSIIYRQKQPSVSTYLVSAKTLLNKNCSGSGPGPEPSD